MTDDLVKRLRAVSLNIGYPSTTTLPSEVIRQVADRIEADAKRIAELTDRLFKCSTDLDTYMTAHGTAEARIAELERHLSSVCEQDWHPEHEGRYAELRRRIAEARAALGEKKE